MDQEEILEALAKAGDKRHAARRDEREASHEVATLAKQARAAGIAKLRIARTARLSRTSLEAMLER